MSGSEEFLTVAEVAAILRVPAATVSRLLKSGTLAGINFGTREGWRVRRSDVYALVGRVERIRQDGDQP